MAKHSGPGFPRNTFPTQKGGSGRTTPGVGVGIATLHLWLHAAPTYEGKASEPPVERNSDSKFDKELARLLGLPEQRP